MADEELGENENGKKKIAAVFHTVMIV